MDSMERKKFCVPNLQPVLEVFNYNMLHMCGLVNKQLEMNIEEIKALSGLSAVSVGPEIDMQALRTLLGNSIGVVGNIDHINVLPNSSPEEIDALCKKVIEENKHSPGFMLAPGCEITVDTSKENVKAFVDAARKYGIVN
jgi:uroporphyrinogen decarboxylase